MLYENIYKRDDDDDDDDEDGTIFIRLLVFIGSSRNVGN